jgi:hypothetical protein
LVSGHSLSGNFQDLSLVFSLLGLAGVFTLHGLHHG